MPKRRTGFPPAVREIIRERSWGICEVWYLCHGFAATEQHHRRTRGMGSTRRPETNEAPNALDCCHACHLFITDHPGYALKQGWTLRQAQIPVEVPVLYRGLRWVRLLAGGGLEEVAA